MKKSEKKAYSEKKNIEIAFKMMFSSVVSLRITEWLYVYVITKLILFSSCHESRYEGLSF